jgi:(p)ppGpp synthase/HD superfamily hydrolase
MNPELKDRLEQLAQWHSGLSKTQRSDESKKFHIERAADIRAAIVSADDATKNMLILRAHKAKDRRFSGESITGFDELQEGS